MKIKVELTIEEKIELKTIGLRISSIKDSLGWDTADLAKAAGIDRSNCKKIENGETNTSMTILYAIIQALGLFPSDFFNEEYQAIYALCKKEYEAELMITDEFCESVNKKKVISTIKKYRRYKKISQAEMASKMGVSRDIINNLEYGRGKVSPQLLIALMNEMSVRAEDFRTELGMK